MEGDIDSKDAQGSLQDQVDAFPFLSKLLKPKPTKEQGKDKPVVAHMPVERDSDIYNMNHSKRGVAYIFNHMTFASGKKPREGTDKDRENLKETLKGLDFEVEVFDDRTFRQIDDILETAAEKDHKDEDCILVAVLTHGDLDCLHASDRIYRQDKIWSHFTADKCPSLAGKPKVFFIQACQGDTGDSGVHLKKTIETDAAPMSYKIPSHVDFLIACSTVPGYYSWRNTEKGSWFVQALCDVLREEAATSDLLSMLTKVARKVALNFQSKTDEQKQTPSIISRLIRDLYFTRKPKEINKIDCSL